MEARQQGAAPSSARGFSGFCLFLPLPCRYNEAGTMTGEVHAYRLAVILYKVESLLVCIRRLISCGLSCLPKVLA